MKKTFITLALAAIALCPSQTKAQQNPILPGFHADPEIVYSNLTTPYSYMRSLVTDDLKVLLSGNDLTGGVKPGDSPTEGSGGSLELGSNGTIEA